MSAKTLIAIILLAALGGAGWYYLQMSSAPDTEVVADNEEVRLPGTPFLGVVQSEVVTPELQSERGLTANYGAYLPAESVQTVVVPGSPADEAGLAPGDVILEVNGTRVSAENTLEALIGELYPSATTTLRVLKQGAQSANTITLQLAGLADEPAE